MIQHKVIFPVKECCITADKSVVIKGAKKGPQWWGIWNISYIACWNYNRKQVVCSPSQHKKSCGSSLIVVSACVCNEMDMLLPVTEYCVLLRFLAKLFFVLLPYGLRKPARKLKFIGSAFLPAWLTRPLTLLMCWAIASEWLQTEYSL